jgi:hypothetical protein
LAVYSLNPGEIKEKEFKQEVRIKLGVNGIAEVTEFSLKEIYYEEVAPDKKEEKKEEKKEDGKEGEIKEPAQTEPAKPELK